MNIAFGTLKTKYVFKCVFFSLHQFCDIEKSGQSYVQMHILNQIQNVLKGIQNKKWIDFINNLKYLSQKS